jgi:hypothetical protein
VYSQLSRTGIRWCTGTTGPISHQHVNNTIYQHDLWMHE